MPKISDKREPSSSSACSSSEQRENVDPGRFWVEKKNALPVLSGWHSHRNGPAGDKGRDDDDTHLLLNRLISFSAAFVSVYIARSRRYIP
ncbi:hypothetical protein MRX96_000643 [Rhipicephalus microplus]